MLALTGLVMLFDDEIEQARYAEVLNVTPQAQVMPVSQQLAAVQRRIQKRKLPSLFLRISRI